MKNFAEINRASIGAKKNFNLIEMAKAMKEHKLRHMWRYAAMITLLLTLACGNAWG